MLSLVIFNSPGIETGLIRSLGFASIVKLRDMISDKCKKNNRKFGDTRSWGAIIFVIEDLNEEMMELIVKELPSDVEIPVFQDAIPQETDIFARKCLILSRKGIVESDPKDEKFVKLTKNAFFGLGFAKSKHKLSMTEVNTLCHDFAIQEHIDNLLLQPNFLDLEQLRSRINIDKEYESRLSGILVDIKSIWYALEYVTYRAASVSARSDAGARFKRYIYITDSIYRIGALSERLVGLAVLLERPKDFDKVFSSKKIRKTFIRDFRDSKNVVTAKIWDFMHSLDLGFADEFRTPEMHKIGRAIQWVAQERMSNDVNRLLAYQNDLNYLLRRIAELLKCP